MASEAELRYVVRVQDRELRELKKQLADTGREAGSSLPKGVDRGSKSLDKLNRAANVAGAALLGGLLIGAKKSADAASDLGEQINKTDVVFGRQAPGILAWSKTTASALGLSRRASLEATGTFGNMLKPMGLVPKVAAGMSRNLVTLGADLASFNNANPEEVLDALRAGLAGETEPLRRFGIFLSAARVEAEAMRLGLVKNVKNMDEVRAATTRLELAQSAYNQAVKEYGPNSDQAKRALLTVNAAENKLAEATKGSKGEVSAAAKAQATYQLIMKDSADAQGDFARTSDSMANKQRIARARLEDTAAAFGDELVPIMTDALGVGLDLLDWTESHRTETKLLVGGILGLIAAVKLYVIASKAYVAATTAGTLTNRILNGVLRAQRVLLMTSIIGALVLVGIALFTLWKKSETFRNIVKGAISGVKKAFDTLVDAGIWLRDQTVAVWDKIKGVVLFVVDSALRAFDMYLGGIEGLLHVLGKMPGPFGAPFRAAENAVEGARAKVRQLRGAVAALKSRKIDVTVGWSFRAAQAKGSREGQLPSGGDISHADIVGHVNRTFDRGIVRSINSTPNALDSLFGGPPRRDLDSRLWQEAGLAAAMGLTVGSTHRPGSRVRGSGALSDHSFYPSKAMDVFGSSARMREYALAVAGSPGVDTVIYSALGRGRGLWRGAWGPITSQATYDDHFSHVHVDTFDRGGWLAPRSVTLAINRTNQWEPVGPPGAGGGISEYHFHFPNYVGDRRELAAAVRDAFEEFERRNGRRP